MTDKGKKIVRVLISIILIIASLYYAFKGINLATLWKIIINANYLWVLLSIPVILTSHLVRAIRWKTMLEPALKVKSASTWNLFSAVMIGYAFNCILPRGGELIRPYVYSRRENVSYTSVFATVIVERVIDVITLVGIFGFVFLFMGGRILKALPAVDSSKVFIIILLFIAVFLLSFYPPIFKFLIRVLIKPISHKFYEKINSLFDKFLKGFAIIKSPSRYFNLGWQSLLIWFLYTVPMFLMFFSFPFQSTLHLGFQDAILLIIISGIGVTIAPTPGALGVYHFLIQNAMMQFYGLSPEISLAYATLTHGVNYLLQIITGGLFFMRENLRKIPFKQEDVSEEIT